MILKISAQNIALLLGSVEIAPHVVDILGTGIPDGLFMDFDLDPDDGLELLAAVMIQALNSGDRQTRRSMGRLATKIQEQLARHGVALDQDPETLLRNMENHNDHPQAELGGFTPRELATLLHNDWDLSSPGLQLHSPGTLDGLEQSDVLHNARILLNSLGRSGEKATTAGNLNRAFVARMLEAMKWSPGYLKDLHHFNKVINEQDAWDLHDLRLILELARLVAKRKGRFVATSLGREMAAPDHAGDLLTLLIRTTFQVFNLGYHDRLPELNEFQDTIAYPFAVLARLDSSWQKGDSLKGLLLLPAIAERIPPHQLIDYGEFLIRLRLLERLEGFGLLECRRSTEDRHRLREIVEIRKTNLFDEVVRIELPKTG